VEYGVQHQQDIIGTSTSPETLTASFADNQSSTWPVGGMHSIVVYVQYTPKAGQSNRLLYIRYELGATSDRLYRVTQRMNVLSDNDLIERIPYDEQFLGATGGTTYSERFSLDDVSDKHFRVSFKESGSSNFGTIYSEILYSGR